jgi:hypothetical protein
MSTRRKSFRTKSSQRKSSHEKNPKNVWKIQFLTLNKQFRNNVLKTLNAADSWGIRVVEGTPADVFIGISPTRQFSKLINGKRVYFSATIFQPHQPPIVLFDPVNYMYGVKRSGLSVAMYRRYLINHEFGHCLGKKHLPCPQGTVCPVLYQMTKGIPYRSKPNYQVTEKDRKASVNN